MSATGATPAEALAWFFARHADIRKVCVGFSGGRDSHVLLHSLASFCKDDATLSLRAMHVDHGLHTDSSAWAAHCETVCDALDIPILIREVYVDAEAEGVEAGARRARYAAFIDVIEDGEHIMLGQHANDQAETFLLQALRGSGPDGLSAMPHERRFGRGMLSRPLLVCSSAALARYAQTHKLSWVDDPSNRDTSFDRNYLRQKVLPHILARWPAGVHTLARTADRCGAASRTLLSLAGDDLDRVRDAEAGVLRISALRDLPRERIYNVLRLWVRQSGRRMPRLRDLQQVQRNLLSGGKSTGGLVNAREYEFRRYADRLYLLSPQGESEPFHYEWVPPFDDLTLSEIGVRLSRTTAAEQGIALPEDKPVLVRSREGGEVLKLGDPPYHKPLKKICQESGVPPWRRDMLPLLFVDGELAAVWNVAVAVDHRLPAPAADGESPHIDQ